MMHVHCDDDRSCYIKYSYCAGCTLLITGVHAGRYRTLV